MNFSRNFVNDVMMLFFFGDRSILRFVAYFHQNVELELILISRQQIVSKVVFLRVKYTIFMAYFLNMIEAKTLIMSSWIRHLFMTNSFVKEVINTRSFMR